MKYNVIVVLADQMQAGMMGCAGHPQAITPNFDRFAAEGLRFTNTYCQNPICTPSRVSILSGQYCHNHGYYGLSGPVTPGLPSFMSHFRQHGYRTAGYGKLHLPDSPRNWLADHVDEFGDTYDEADGSRGGTEFFKGLAELGLRELEDSWHSDAWKELKHDARPSDLPYEHTQERWSAGKALEFIDRYSGEPFCIEVAFQKPHHPLLPQKEFWDMYPEDLDIPPTFNLEPDGRPPHFRKMWNMFRETKWPMGTPGEPSEAAARRMWRGTLACVTQIDDVFGRILQGLEERGLSENTIVIFSSDHGSYHTVHGIQEKAPGTCSDSVCRVPAIWKVPGVTTGGSVSDALVENVDIAATIPALCGLPPMDTVDGKDIRPLLDGSGSAVREVAVTENAWSKSIRFGKWRFVHYQPEHFGEDIGELYDIEGDPLETANLYNDPAHQAIVVEARRKLLGLIRTTRVVTSQTYPGTPVEGTTERTYPIAGDGRSPNEWQPINRDYRQNPVNAYI